MKEDFKFVIITGLSGAGKSQAVRVLEDADYFCVDNLPPALVPKFVELCAQSGGKIKQVALVMDIRGGEFFRALTEALAYLRHHEWPHEVLFLEASDEVLIRRFKETRRRHPLSGEGSILDGIKNERQALQELRGRADKVIDTTQLTPAQLKEEVQQLFLRQGQSPVLLVRLVSFGFKHGLPLDADFVFDLRFLPNPFYVAELKSLTGLDQGVKEYVFQASFSHDYLNLIQKMLEFAIPHCLVEGKAQLVVALGCTGGKHRSVAMAESLRDKLLACGQRTVVEHRHISEGV